MRRLNVIARQFSYSIRASGMSEKTSVPQKGSVEEKITKSADPILYFTFPSPNGLKVDIFVSEQAMLKGTKPLAIERRLVNIMKREQYKPEFLAINPNNKIPAIQDSNGLGSDSPIEVFESGAILLYLSEKADWAFFPWQTRSQYYEGLKWIFWQMAGVGPMISEAAWYVAFAPRNEEQAIAYGSKRYVEECKRLIGVLETHLSQTTEGWVWNNQYSIVDMILYPAFVVGQDRLKFDYSDYPNVQEWMKKIGSRPAVKSAYAQRDKIFAENPIVPAQVLAMAQIKK